jgi:hypothetical protein
MESTLFTRSRELRHQLVELLAEMRRSGFIRTGNHVACFGERFIADYWQVELPPPSNAGWDVLTPMGERIQVKARWHCGRSKPTAIALDVESGHWDAVAVVLFNEQLSVEAAWHVPRSIALSLARKQKRKYRLFFRHIINHPEVRNYPPEMSARDDPAQSAQLVELQRLSH